MLSACLPACLADRQTGKMKSRVKQEKSKRKKKKRLFFFFLRLCSGIWAFGSPPPKGGGGGDLHRLSASSLICQGSGGGCRHAGVCSLRPRRAGMAVGLQPFRVTDARPVAVARERGGGGSGEWKWHIQTRRRWFYCSRRAVPTERSDAGVGVCVCVGVGGGREKELWIRMDRRCPPSLLVFLSLPPAVPPSFNSSRLLRRPSASSHHPAHSFSSFFFFLNPSMHPPFLLLSPSLPQLNAIMVMDFSPLA